MNSNIKPFYFKNIKIQESCWIDGKPYFTRLAIGKFLEYSNPQKAIDKIVERNPHIDNSAWSVTVKMTGTDGKLYDTKLHDPIALQLIINKSNQPKAIAFQVAVANLVVAYMSGDLTDFSLDDVHGYFKNLFNFSNMVVSLTSIPKRNRMILACAEKNGYTVRQVLNLVRQRTGVSLSSPRQIRRKFSDDYAKVVAYHREHPHTGGRYIKLALGLSASERIINQWLREQMFRAA
jgi:hypothetical protein